MKSTKLTDFIPRIIISIVIGLLLVLFPEFFQNFLMIILGSVIALIGVIQLIMFFVPKKDDVAVMERRRVPFGSIITMAIGLLLILKAALFTEILVFSLGFILLIAGIGQIAMYMSLKRNSNVPPQMYIFPVLIIIAGLVAIFNPFGAIRTLIVFFGATMLFYGIAELFTMAVIKKK